MPARLSIWEELIEFVFGQVAAPVADQVLSSVCSSICVLPHRRSSLSWVKLTLQSINCEQAYRAVSNHGHHWVRTNQEVGYEVKGLF